MFCHSGFRMQQAKQAEEVDSQVNKKNFLSSSPSNTSLVTGSDGDESSLNVGFSKCGKDPESSLNAESPAEKDKPFCHPRDVLERLALPPAKDLDSLLQDAVKPVVSSKPQDLRNGKPLSHRVSLPPFPWSQNFNGHNKSNNDSVRLSNRSLCQGRWVRIRSNASFIGGGNEDFADLDSLTYDNSLVPAGQFMYKLPEIESSSSTPVNQQCCQQNSPDVHPTSLPPSAEHSPRVLAAAQTLCDIATDYSKRISNGLLKWPKQPSQKAMKARKSRSTEKPEEFLTPKSETILDHVVRSIEYGSSSKKSKISVVECREDFGHIHAVIGLSSVSAPRSNRSSPNRLSKDSVVEARNLNGSFVKPQFMAPPPRVPDRSNHNSQKVRKVSPMDWNRTRS
ncbi:Co-chaperone protein HscB-like protein [Bienertia sinuspersici]